MGIEIIWTKKAVKTFGKRITYLEEHWTEKRYLILRPVLMNF